MVSGGTVGFTNGKTFQGDRIGTEKNSEMLSMRKYYERKIAIQQKLIERQNKRLGLMAHDLRSPLTLILNALDVYESIAGEAERQAIRERLKNRTQQMIKTINELISNSRIDSGSWRLEKQLCDIREGLLDTIESHRLRAATKGVDLKVSFPKIPVMVSTDILRLCEIVENLVDNAVKYSRSGGAVEVVLENQEQYIQISVADNGVGIRPEELESIFEEFSSATNRPTDGEPSSGLGLSIVRKLTRLLGGKVWAQSTSGKGSNFYIRLPFA